MSKHATNPCTLLILVSGERKAIPNISPAKSNENARNVDSTTKDRRLEGEEGAPYANYCRSDAPIWAKYLEEAEIEDKEVTELWNSSLDSLLVFVSRLVTPTMGTTQSQTTL